jgi:hypothetical protein
LPGFIAPSFDPDELASLTRWKNNRESRDGEEDQPRAQAGSSARRRRPGLRGAVRREEDAEVGVGCERAVKKVGNSRKRVERRLALVHHGRTSERSARPPPPRPIDVMQNLILHAISYFGLSGDGFTVMLLSVSPHTSSHGIADVELTKLSLNAHNPIRSLLLGPTPLACLDDFYRSI